MFGLLSAYRSLLKGGEERQGIHGTAQQLEDGQSKRMFRLEEVNGINPFQKSLRFPQVCPFLSPTGPNEVHAAGAMPSSIIWGREGRCPGSLLTFICNTWFRYIPLGMSWVSMVEQITLKEF